MLKGLLHHLSDRSLKQNVLIHLQMKIQNHHNTGYHAKGNQITTHQSLSQCKSHHPGVPIWSSRNHSPPSVRTLAHHRAFLIPEWVSVLPVCRGPATLAHPGQRLWHVNGDASFYCVIHRVPGKSQEGSPPRWDTLQAGSVCQDLACLRQSGPTGISFERFLFPM